MQHTQHVAGMLSSDLRKLCHLQDPVEYTSMARHGRVCHKMGIGHRRKQQLCGLQENSSVFLNDCTNDGRTCSWLTSTTCIRRWGWFRDYGRSLTDVTRFKQTIIMNDYCSRNEQKFCLCSRNSWRRDSNYLNKWTMNLIMQILGYMSLSWRDSL